MSKKIRIAMIPTANGGVNYFRMAMWAYEMRKYRNVEVALYEFCYGMNDPHPWQKDLFGNPDVRYRIENLCKVADVVLWGPVHYSYTYDFFTEMKNKYGKLTLVDMDDNYVDVPEWNEAFHSFGPNSFHRRIALQCLHMADGVIVSTPHLKELYSRYNENVHIVENSLDFKGDSKFIGWDKASVKKHKGLRIGWIGGRSHFNDLDMISPVLKKVLTRHPEVQLSFVNSAFKTSYEALKRPYPFEGLKNVHLADRSVPINRYARFYGHFGFDIALAPLVDCNFNRSKSNLRWLEASAMRLPCVASDISHFSQTVRNGVDGILVKPNDLDHWEAVLELLIKDEVYREAIGREAGKRIRKDFNVKKNAAKYFRLIKTLLNTTIMGSEDAIPEMAEVA